MTEKYIAAAHKVAVGFGVPLPELPASLLERSTERSKNASDWEGTAPNMAGQFRNSVATPTGIEFGNGDSRKLSVHAVLADKSRDSLEELVAV